MFSTTWRFNVMKLQCERTFITPPRGASDRPLVFFSIAAVPLVLEQLIRHGNAAAKNSAVVVSRHSKTSAINIANL